MNELTTTIKPDIETMKRADAPAIWGDFKSKIIALKNTAETLTVTDESDKAGMKLARATRLNLREIRIAVEAKRKELGEEYLRRTQQINADAKALKELIEPLETRLLECEQFAERAEAARVAERLATRTAAVVKLNGDPSSYNLAGCSDEAFDGIIGALTAAEKALVEAAQKAEAERIAKLKADAEERERIRLENIRLAEEAAKLRAEAEAREKAAAEERKAAAAAQAKQAAEFEAARKKQAAIDAEKLRVANEAAAAERRKAIEAQAEIDRQKAEAAKAEQERKAAEEKAAAAPDVEKLRALVKAIRDVDRPALSTTRAFEIRNNAFAKLEIIAEEIESDIKTL